jgi:hypothetical protein
MRKILFILTLSLLLFSCTFVESSDTEVNCPCQITQISAYNGGYEVKAKSIQNSGEWFTFRTTVYHQIGDKIE